MLDEILLEIDIQNLLADLKLRTFSKLDKKIRYDIRKAEENNVIFNIANDKTHLFDYDKLKESVLDKTYNFISLSLS